MRKQKEKRKKEMKHAHTNGNNAPGPLQAMMIKGDLFGLISRPDDQQLREREVGPEHVEGEKQFAEIVQVAFLNDVRKGLTSGKHGYHENHKRHRRNGLACDEHEAVNRGSPMRRKRHCPVNRKKAHTKHIKNDSRTGEKFDASAQLAIVFIA